MKPVFISWTELCLGEMAEDRRHGHLTPAPWRAEVVFEAVILDVLIARIALGA